MAAAAVIVSGCAGGGGPEGDSNFLDNAIAVTTGALAVTNAAAGIANAASPPPQAPLRAPAAAAKPVAPPSGDLNQRQAFEACAATYRAAGREDLVRICEQRAANMGSLR